MGKLVCVFLMILLLTGIFGCGPYRCPEEEVQVIQAEPVVVTEYVEKGGQLSLSMSYVLFFDSGKYKSSDASADVLLQIEDEILTWGEEMRQAGVQLAVTKFMCWGGVDGQPLSPRLYKTLQDNYTFSFTPPAYSGESAFDEGNLMLSEVRAMEMASFIKDLLVNQGIKVDGETEIGASKGITVTKGEINFSLRRVTIRVEVRGTMM
jgi:hypothetical protein